MSLSRPCYVYIYIIICHINIHNNMSLSRPCMPGPSHDQGPNDTLSHEAMTYKAVGALGLYTDTLQVNKALHMVSATTVHTIHDQLV